MKEVWKKAIEIYGKEKQLDMLIEEMSELTKEICKLKRGKDNHNQIVEEMADVYIMLEQLCMICDIIPHEINMFIEIKTSRLKKQLEKING